MTRRQEVLPEPLSLGRVGVPVSQWLQGVGDSYTERSQEATWLFLILCVAVRSHL